MTEKNTDQEFVEYIVKSLVNHPDDVVVERKIDEIGVFLTLKVNPADMALVIGRKGSTVRAIEALAIMIGLRSHSLVNFKIEEPEGSFRTKQDAEHVRGFVRDSMRMKMSEMEVMVDELKS